MIRVLVYVVLVFALAQGLFWAGVVALALIILQIIFW